MAKNKAALPAITPDENGIVFAEDAKNAFVAFDFNSMLARMLHRVDGAKFDREENCWIIPIEQREKLVTLIPEMRLAASNLAAAKEEITKESVDFALAQQAKNGTDEGITPKVSDYRVPHQEMTGEIIAANSHYVAQFTGLGSLDKAAFVTLHLRDDLDKDLFKGDKAAITYNDKYKANVRTYLTQDDLVERFDKSLGGAVDGVSVTRSGTDYLVQFEYNPALQRRISHIDGAEFDKEAKVWVVAADKKPFLARAVNDMRNEVVNDKAERQQLEAIGAQKMNDAVVRPAFTKDGQAHSGEIVAVTSRYAMQHTGKQYFSLHRLTDLDKEVREGKPFRIQYQAGKAQVTDQSKSRGAEVAR